MDKSLEYHTATLLNVAVCLESGKHDWAKRLSNQRRKDLFTFIDDPEAEVDEAFMDIFNCIVASLGSKITFKLFELVLKIGLNFTAAENDAYWFALFKCNDYGTTFDQPEICELLIDEVFLSNSNSWKAACLLCILIQDYRTANGITARLLFKDTARLSNLFEDIRDYTLCCYMTELLSQLNAPELISHVFPNHLKVKIIDGMYANDALCTRFLGQFNQSSTIHHINSFSIEGVVQCGPSMCQLYPYFFVVLVNHSEYTSPVQFDFTEIISVQNNEKRVRFHLGQQNTKTLLSVDIPSLAVVNLVFPNVQMARSVTDALNKVTKQTMMSTPRKISVVQDFIKVNSKIYDEAEESSSLSDAILTESSPARAQNPSEPPEQDPTTRARHPSSDDSFLPEDNSMFGSPAMNNTTKDTSTSKHGRAISAAIADASRKKATTIEPVSSVRPSNPVVSSIIPVAQVPDSMDTALNQLNKENRGKEDSRASSSIPANSPKKATASKVLSKKTDKKAPPAPIDIWDFDDSDPDKTLQESAATSKTMKFLSKGPVSKANHHSVNAKKTSMQKKLENVDMVPEVPTKDIIVHSNDSHLLMSESFSGLTSPLASRNERTASKTTKKRGTDERHEEDDVLDNGDEPHGTKKRKTRSMSDESYQPSQVPVPEPSDADKEKVSKLQNKQKETPIAPKRSTRASKAHLQRLDEAEENTESNVSREAKRPPPPPPPKKTANHKASAPPVKKQATKASVSKPLVGSTKSNTGVTDHVEQPQQMRITQMPQPQAMSQEHQQLMASLTPPDLLNANMLLSEAYTNTLQKQIYESINVFSNQLVKKIQIINDEINKKVMTDLTNKYETLFNDLRGSFQKDVDEMCGFIGDVKGLLNLPEKQLVDYIKQKKFGQISGADD